MKVPTGVLLSLAFWSCYSSDQTQAATPATATTIRAASVTPAPEQPQATDKALIFYDDFVQRAETATRYFEYVAGKGSFVWKPDGGAEQWRNALPVRETPGVGRQHQAGWLMRGAAYP